MANKNNSCKNCSNIYEGNFCNLCGQTSNTHRINFHYIIHEIQHSVFHVDGGIFYTIKELFLRPGISIREFINGKRVKHFKPVTFVIIISIIYAYLEHKTDKNPFIEELLLGILEGMKGDNVAQRKLNIFDWLIHHYSYTALFLIPVFSLASFLVFKSSKYNYFEHLVLNTFLFGQITVIFLLTIFFPDNSLGEIIRIAFVILYTFWAYNQFFANLSFFSKIMKTVATYIIFTTSLFIILFILMGIIFSS